MQCAVCRQGCFIERFHCSLVAIDHECDSCVCTIMSALLIMQPTRCESRLRFLTADIILIKYLILGNFQLKCVLHAVRQ